MKMAWAFPSALVGGATSETDIDFVLCGIFLMDGVNNYPQSALKVHIDDIAA